MLLTFLNMMKNQNIDITNFEDKINKFRDGFAKNYMSASNHFQKAIEEIDKSLRGEDVNPIEDPSILPKRKKQ